MDTLTHALSGALLARATAPDPARARITTAARMAAGALAAAFPDTDFFLAYVSPVAYLTGHRGITHSIFLLPIWALMLAWLLSKTVRGRGATWRDWFGVCALGIGAHIVGDLITSFGTMIYAPFSDARVAWSTTFIIDLWFSGIILAGLAASAVFRRSRVPAIAGLAVLAGYVGLQAFAHSRAIDFGVEHARRAGFQAARVSAIPRPVSPFNWTVMVTEGDRYHYADVNLVRDAAPPDTGGFISRLDAQYAPLALARWVAVEKYGAGPAQRELATRALGDPQLGVLPLVRRLPGPVPHRPREPVDLRLVPGPAVRDPGARREHLPLRPVQGRGRRGLAGVSPPRRRLARAGGLRRFCRYRHARADRRLLGRDGVGPFAFAQVAQVALLVGAGRDAPYVPQLREARPLALALLLRLLRRLLLPRLLLLALHPATLEVALLLRSVGRGLRRRRSGRRGELVLHRARLRAAWRPLAVVHLSLFVDPAIDLGVRRHGGKQDGESDRAAHWV